MTQKNRKTRYIIAFAAMIVLLVLLFCWNVGAGSVEMSLTDFVHLMQKPMTPCIRLYGKYVFPASLRRFFLAERCPFPAFCSRAFFRIPLRDHMCWEFHQGQSLLWRLS